MVEIKAVEERSRAWHAGIRQGDILLSINDHPIKDVLDYRFYLAETTVLINCLRARQTLSFTIHKGIYDDIGLSFETPLMDKKQHCKNACIFCFIDQLPRGMRESLYFKDDDSRLSFLHGNYITLTNMTDEDIDRIIKMRFSPMNISVHTTNPQLRVQMMKNPRAGDVLSYLQRLKNAGLTMHAQIVLCRGVNDGEELERSMQDLAKLYPELDSVSVVPAGLTDHRDGLYPLQPFSSDDCAEVIRQVNAFGDECMQKIGSRLFYLADEFYLGAGQPIPHGDYYEEYAQIENGVGMLRSFEDEFEDALSLCKDEILALGEKKHEKQVISIATGEAAYDQICRITRRITEHVPWLHIHVYAIKNNFFGKNITVSGLLTGKDIAEQLEGKHLGSALLLPRSTMRAEGDLFLCGMSCEALSEKLSVPIVFIENDGGVFLDAILELIR